MSARRPVLQAVFLALCALLWGPLPASAHLILSGTGSAPVVTNTFFVLSGRGTSNLSTGTVRYLSPTFVMAPSTTSIKGTLWPFSGKIVDVIFTVDTAPTGTANFRADLQLNGSIVSGANCSVSGTAQSGVPLGSCRFTGSFAFSAGDWTDVKITPTATGGTLTGALPSLSVVVQPDNPNDTAIMSLALTNTFSGTSTGQALIMGSGSSPSAITSRRSSVFPDAGYFDRMFANAGVAVGVAGGGQAYDFMISKNGNVTWNIVADIFEEASAASDVNPLHQTAVSACDDGQFYGFPSTTSTAPPNVNAALGARYVPNTPGAFGLYAATNLAAAYTAAAYVPLSGLSAGAFSTETSVATNMHSMTFLGGCAKATVAPGASGSGKYFDVYLRSNFGYAADGSGNKVGCRIFETATTCVMPTVSVTTADYAKLDVEFLPVNSPATSALGAGFLVMR